MRAGLSLEHTNTKPTYDSMTIHAAWVMLELVAFAIAPALPVINAGTPVNVNPSVLLYNFVVPVLQSTNVRPPLDTIPTIVPPKVVLENVTALKSNDDKFAFVPAL